MCLCISLFIDHTVSVCVCVCGVHLFELACFPFIWIHISIERYCIGIGSQVNRADLFMMIIPPHIQYVLNE